MAAKAMRGQALSETADRYQIVHEHKRAHMIIEDTGLGLERSDKAVLL
jgi:hypothetical protein